QAEAELQLNSDELVSAAAVLLARGRYADALPILRKANDIYASERAIVHLLWARFKVDGDVKKEELPLIEKQLDKLQRSSQKNPVFFFVTGLLEKRLGNASNAIEF